GLKFDHSGMQAKLQKALSRSVDVTLPPAETMKIPVCYGGEFGPELGGGASLHGIFAGEVGGLHSEGGNGVYFFGFVSGFAYLGGLPTEITTPRLAVPRKQVPAGSVAIGGSQTGVYPAATPGGWRLIGRTPLKMFDAASAHSTLLQIGDEVRFVPVSA